MWEQGLQLSAAMEMSGRFVMSGFFALLLLATAGCSFKKNPARTTQVTFVEEKASPVVVPSIEEIIAGEDEEKSIEQLAERRVEVERLAKNISASAIDLAIKYKKTKILSYLLVNGHSPFVLNQDSREKIGYDRDLSIFMRSAQHNIFEDILSRYHRFGGDESKISELDLNKALEDYQFGFRGCEDLADTIMEAMYLQSKPRSPFMFSALIGTKYCAAYKDYFSSDRISKWIGFEYVYQYQSGFREINFLKDLMSLKKNITIRLVLPAGGLHADYKGLISSHVLVDPIGMLMLKRPCFENADLFDEWMLVAKSLIDSEGPRPSSPYLFADEIDGLGEACGDEGNYCSENLSNVDSLWTLYRYEFPESRFSWAQFRSLYIGRAVNESEYKVFPKELKIFREELCRVPERRVL
nr:hypothetical protein HAGR004_29740 [Bdellovibrio sp. HAGR004]